MAIIRKKDLKSLSKKEMEDRIEELKLEILKIKSKKVQPGTGSKKMKEIKRTIARLYTQIKEK